MSANRTTEKEVGFLSRLVSTLWIRKAEALLKQLDEEDGDPLILIDYKMLGAMGKWVLDNGILAAPDAESEDSPLRARLNEIQAKSRNRVLDFRKEHKEGSL